MTSFDAAWHVGGPVCDLYARGALDPVIASSVEAHLTGCVDCRALLAPAVDAARLTSIYAEIVDRVDAPPASVVERLLRRLGLREDIARLLVITPVVRGAWLLAIGGVLAFAVLAASADPRGYLAFLCVAPLAPLAGVAAAYGRRTDPVHELGVAAPFDGLRLLLIRGAAVLCVTVLLAAPAGLLLEHRAGAAWSWLLPALGLSAIALALAERIEVSIAAGSVATGWLAVVLTMRLNHTVAAVFGGVAQVAFAVVALCAAFVVHRGRDRFNYSGGLR